MKTIFQQFLYLLDAQDRKGFVRFIGWLFLGGVTGLFGIGAVIPFIQILIDPDHVTNLPVIGDMSYLQAVSLCAGVLIAAFWVKNVTAFWVVKKQAQFLSGVVAKVQKRLFKRYIYSPYETHVKRNSSTLISNINVETNILANQVISKFGTVLNESITSGVVFVALLFISPVFTLLVVGVIVITGHQFMARLRHQSRYYSRQRGQHNRQLAQTVVQSLGGIKESKIYQKEPFFQQQVDHHADGLAKAGVFSQIFQQAPRFLIEAVAITVVLATMIGFVLAGYTGQQLLVLMSVFGVASVQLLPSMNRLMQGLTSIRYGQAALDNIYQEIKHYDAYQADIEQQHKSRDTSVAPVVFNKAIELTDVTFSYGDEVILQQVHLTIPKGKKVALVGPSGAGKTTLVDVILGVLAPSGGTMTVDGTTITNDNIGQWQRHFGYIPQVIYLYDCSLRQNIAFGLSASEIDDDQVWDCLKQAALLDFVQQDCPDGLDTLVGENGIRLSGGQRQRIGIARALYHNPDILVMDEATAALDNQTEKHVTQALSQVAKERTIITIAHRLTTIENYDIIYVMEKGRVVDHGDYQTLCGKNALFRDMVQANDVEVTS